MFYAVNWYTDTHKNHIDTFSPSHQEIKMNKKTLIIIIWENIEVLRQLVICLFLFQPIYKCNQKISRIKNFSFLILQFFLCVKYEKNIMIFVQPNYNWTFNFDFVIIMPHYYNATFKNQNKRFCILQVMSVRKSSKSSLKNHMKMHSNMTPTTALYLTVRFPKHI